MIENYASCKVPHHLG